MFSNKYSSPFSRLFFLDLYNANVSMVDVSLCYAMLSHFSRVRLCATPQMAATRLPRPWDSPGKNTGVGCHFFLQCMKVKSESEVAQSCLTLSDPMDCSLPGSSIHGIFQARVLEWGAIAFSRIFSRSFFRSPLNSLYLKQKKNLSSLCFSDWMISAILSSMQLIFSFVLSNLLLIPFFSYCINQL